MTSTSRRAKLRTFQWAGLWLAPVLLTGCGLGSAVLQPGGNGRTGVLLNLSCGAQACDPLDPGKPTVVITHGWNPLPNLIHSNFGPSGARSIRCRFGDQVNVLSWDWNAVRVPALNDQPYQIATEQGRRMAAALRHRGIDPTRTHLIGHSLGSIAMTQAAQCLSDLGCTAQLTLLDPPEIFHERMFGELGATRNARVVENYWAPGISGFGAPVCCGGVRNYEIPGSRPVAGMMDLSVSNHVNVMAWYESSIRCGNIPGGFQRSFIVCGCNQN